MPTVVIQRIKLLIFGHPNRIKVAGNRLFPGDFPFDIGLLDSTLENSPIVIQSIGAFPVISDGRGTFVAIFVYHPSTLSFNRLTTLLGYVVFDDGIDFLQDFGLIVFQWRSGVAFYTASAFASVQVTYKKVFFDIVRQ